MNRIVVTGGAGFIGSNFIRYWLEGHPRSTILNYDALTYAGNPATLVDIEETYGDRYQLVEGDIGNHELAVYVFRHFVPDCVVNFAAESHNSRSVIDPRTFYSTNVLGTQSLLEAARVAGVGRLHHVSTCEVYGDLALDSDEAFGEDWPLRPRTPYNASKAAADLAVRAYAETFGLAVTVSVCSNNYGPYQFPEKMIPNFTTRALRGQPLPLYASNRNRREWLHVEDHCRAIEAILERGELGRTYNVGSGFEVDVETMADTILGILDGDPALKTYVPDRPGHDRRYLLDSTRIRTELGWTPQVAWEQGICDTVTWYRDNPGWWGPLLAKLAVDEEGWR
jgi:dTDP-glucose 4,6-dehydratase